MAYCRNCGKQIPDSAELCDACTQESQKEAQRREAWQAQWNAQQTWQAQQSDYQPAQQPAQPAASHWPIAAPSSMPPNVIYEERDPTTIGGWIGWMILCTILPFIGSLIIALGEDRPETLRNYGKANLVIQGIGLLLILISYSSLWAKLYWLF